MDSYFCRKNRLNNYFRFKSFTIYQQNTAMKVGIDGVLLGAWTSLGNGCRILDVGTGTGLLALMMAQRNTESLVDAVEIDYDAAADAYMNVLESPFAKRIKVFASDICDFESPAKYGLIISNPPYFVNNLRGNDRQRNIARHTESLDACKVLQFADANLESDGKVSMIYPFEYHRMVENCAWELSLYPLRRCKVSMSKLNTPTRMMVEYGRSRNYCTDSELCVRDQIGYSESYKELTKDFYLYL